MSTIKDLEYLPSQPVVQNTVERQEADIDKLIDEALEPRVV